MLAPQLGPVALYISNAIVQTQSHVINLKAEEKGREEIWRGKMKISHQVWGIIWL